MKYKNKKFKKIKNFETFWQVLTSNIIEAIIIAILEVF